MHNTAIAWDLVSRSTGVGKVYQILVVEDMVITGWGSLASDARAYKVQTHPSHGAAIEWAVHQTANKERGDYVIYHSPRTAPVDATHLLYLRGRVPLGIGSDPKIKDAFALIIRDGFVLPQP
jgi:hypothetical protein